MPYRLGVDLGTTFTAAAVADGAAPVMVGLGNRALQVPSVLFLQTDGTFLVGEPAERRARSEPHRVAREFKRRIGDPVPILIAGSPYSPESLTATMLHWVVVTATERMGEPPGEVVLTHPANWGPYKLALLEQIVSLADLPGARFLPEPMAAGAQFAASNAVAVGDRLAVYDLGGGTFDISVMEKAQDGLRLLGTPEGIEHLGGVDFDEAVFQRALAMAGDPQELDHADPDVSAGLSRLRRDCVDAKEALSSDTDAVLPLSVPGLSPSVRITRSEFEAMVRPPLLQTVAAMSRALRSAGVEPQDLRAIVLIGGSSRIPLVGELLIREFKVRTALNTHPKHDVALGAAQWDHTFAAPVPAVVSTSLLRADGPSSGDGPTDPAGPADVADRQLDASGRGLRRRHLGGRAGSRLVLLVGVGLVCVGILVAYLVLRPSTSGRPVATASTTPGPTTASSRTDPTPSAPPVVLPRSTPLTDTQLVVPMRVAGRWELYLGDTEEGAPVRQLTSGSGNAYSPALSPDFATMIYLVDPSGSGTHRILRFAGAADGADPKDLFSTVPDYCAGNMFRPAWRPDDPTVLAVPCLDGQGRYGLYLVRTDGTLIRAVRVDQQRVDDPTFSPSGQQLAFWAGPLSGFDGGVVYTTDADGTSKPTALSKAAVAGQDTDPAWSPVGDAIAFRRRVSDGTTGGNADVYVMRPDGREPRPLTRDAADEQDPSWSRFGSRIVYKSAAPARPWPGKAVSRTWVMNADGSQKHVLWVDGPDGVQGAPAWSRR